MGGGLHLLGMLQIVSMALGQAAIHGHLDPDDLIYNPVQFMSCISRQSTPPAIEHVDGPCKMQNIPSQSHAIWCGATR